MQSSHPADYEKYGVQLGKILESPDYVAINRKDRSLEYVKEFLKRVAGKRPFMLCVNRLSPAPVG